MTVRRGMTTAAGVARDEVASFLVSGAETKVPFFLAVWPPRLPYDSSTATDSDRVADGHNIVSFIAVTRLVSIARSNHH
jgi:hypothetical protein